MHGRDRSELTLMSRAERAAVCVLLQTRIDDEAWQGASRLGAAGERIPPAPGCRSGLGFTPSTAPAWAGDSPRAFPPGNPDPDR